MQAAEHVVEQASEHPASQAVLHPVHAVLQLPVQLPHPLQAFEQLEEQLELQELYTINTTEKHEKSVK